MISVDEARKTVVDSVFPVGVERVPLLEAHHRVAAADVISNDDIPPFDNSSMDGFALMAEDVQRADQDPVRLKLVAEVPAGDPSGLRLAPNTAAQIMTGAPVPDGATAVIEQELIQVRNGSIHVTVPVKKGKNIRKRGEDIRAGDTAVRKGSFLQAAHLGVLASIGASSVEVYKRPKVAFFTTGNELVEVGPALSPGKIRNSNTYSLFGLIRETHCTPVNLGVVRDDEAALQEKVVQGLAHDALITSGGVSVGKYDLILRILAELQVEQKFWKVNVKPGGPVAFSTYEKAERKVPVFSLPGNPVSTVVTFLQFVKPGLEKLMGMQPIRPLLTLKAFLEHEIKKTDKKKNFSRGILRNEMGKLLVKTTGSQSSGALSSMVAANCLVLIPEDKEVLKAGDEVEVELL